MPKFYKYVITALGLTFGVTILILNVFEMHDKWTQIWFLYLSIYIPFYVVYSEKRGVIISKSGDIEKDKSPALFVFHQVLYMGFSIFVFFIILGQLT